MSTAALSRYEFRRDPKTGWDDDGVSTKSVAGRLVRGYKNKASRSDRDPRVTGTTRRVPWGASSEEAGTSDKRQPPHREARTLVRSERRLSQQRPSALQISIEAVLAAAYDPQPGARARAAALLRTAVHEEVTRRPRHAAVALALHDAVLRAVIDEKAGGRGETLEAGARVLLSPYISDEDERALLDDLNRDWRRVTPLDKGPLAHLLSARDD